MTSFALSSKIGFAVILTSMICLFGTQASASRCVVPADTPCFNHELLLCQANSQVEIARRNLDQGKSEADRGALQQALINANNAEYRKQRVLQACLVAPTCNIGFEYKNGVCVAESGECQSGFTKDSNTNTCVCNVEAGYILGTDGSCSPRIATTHAVTKAEEHPVISHCSNDRKLVCGQIKASCDDRLSCAAQTRMFLNTCQMRKAGATFLAYNRCPTGDELRLERTQDVCPAGQVFNNRVHACIPDREEILKRYCERLGREWRQGRCR